MLRLLTVSALLCAIVGCHVISPEHLKNPTVPPTFVAALPTANRTERTNNKLADLKDDHLLAAADCLAENNVSGAIQHLTSHVDKHPDQVIFRMQLAELLLKEDHLLEAQEQFHEVCVHAQEGNASAKKQLVHAHTRLMEIAQARNDVYGEQLHRGIGLYRVVEQLQTKSAAVEPGEIERMLFKAIAAFNLANEQRPEDARLAWYQYLAWQRLEQPRPAAKCLRKALTNAPFSTLTPAEAKALALAPRE